MTSFRQIEANRRNAKRSTGPATEDGKERSRCNAVRHGLTAETVIGTLEDAEDYRAFEAAIIADYDAQSAVERELVLRLASLLWRLRRAATMETGLFEIQAGQLRAFKKTHHARQASRQVLYSLLGQPAPGTFQSGTQSHLPDPDPAKPLGNSAIEITQCFLRLANLPNFALDRLSRYEATLWRQVARVLFALDALERRKPQERRRRAREPATQRPEVD
jgi:hypothetical protein